MNRRSFITKALAGLAAIPLIGKLAQAKQQPQTCTEAIESQEPVAYFPLDDNPLVWAALFTLDERGKTVELSGKGYQRVPVQMDQAVFPRALEDWPQVTHFSWGRNDEEIAANIIDLWRPRYLLAGHTPMLMTR